MKKIFYVLFLFANIGCNSKEMPLPLQETEELIFPQEGGRQVVQLKNDMSNALLIFDGSGEDWCEAELKENKLNVTVKYNASLDERKTSITVNAGQNKAIIGISQKGIGIAMGDEKLKISGGEASSEHTQHEASEFEKSYDGDLSTYWHSEWDVKPPHTIVYDLQDASRLDYIMYYPRSGGGNGNFGEVEIYVSTQEKTEFTKVMNHNLNKSGSPSKIPLPASVTNPKAVKFIVLSGSNDNASCAEMEFYAENPDAVSTVDIPLGGNSYVTTSGGSSGGRVSDDGFTSWTSENTVFSTFFRVNKAGDLKMFLKYRASDDGNIIAVTCQGSVFEVELPKPATRTDTVVFMGVIEKVDPGYMKVDFKGEKLNGRTFASPSSLLVGGASTESMNFVGDFSYYWGRRGPSVHMAYAIPEEVTAEWFYNEVTVPAGYDPVGSYFMANGFSQGYFGMQVNSETERRVLFSVWSPYQTDDPSTIPDEDRVKLIKKSDDVIINDFGDEGSGGQSYLKFDWEAGKTYRFLNRIRPISDGYSEYTAYFYSPEAGKWKLIAQWKRPKTQTFYKGAHSFLENFNNNMGYITRKAYYNNQWVYTSSGQWIELTKGKFTVDATGRPGWRMDYKGGVENNGFFLQNCGFFNDYVHPDTQFDRESTGKQPDINWDDLE